MEQCALVELDLTACLDFSCMYRFHSTFAVYYKTTLAQCFAFQLP